MCRGIPPGHPRHEARLGDLGPTTAEHTENSIFPDHHRQQIIHARDEHGEDVVYGRVRGEFAERQRSTSVHLAFCPPLDTIPELLVRQVEGPEITVKPAEVLPYGMKLDLTLKSMSRDPQTVVVQFFARSQSV